MGQGVSSMAWFWIDLAHRAAHIVYHMGFERLACRWQDWAMAWTNYNLHKDDRWLL